MNIELVATEALGLHISDPTFRTMIQRRHLERDFIPGLDSQRSLRRGEYSTLNIKQVSLHRGQGRS